MWLLHLGNLFCRRLWWILFYSFLFSLVVHFTWIAHTSHIFFDCVGFHFLLWTQFCWLCFLCVRRPHLLAVQIHLLRMCSNFFKFLFSRQLSVTEKLAGVCVHDRQILVDVVFQMCYGRIYCRCMSCLWFFFQFCPLSVCYFSARRWRFGCMCPWSCVVRWCCWLEFIFMFLGSVLMGCFCWLIHPCNSWCG